MNNEVIITDLEFQLNNFNGTGADYDVEVYAQDPEDNDYYTVKIINTEEPSESYSFQVDSCGGMEGGTVLGELERYILGILFGEEHKGIIRGF